MAKVRGVKNFIDANYNPFAPLPTFAAVVMNQEHYDAYADLRTSEVPEYLNELLAETQRDIPVANMISGKMQGRFLSMLSHLIKPKCILELGTYTGYSALCLAEGLANNGTLHTIEHHDRLIPFAQKYFDRSGMSDRIQLHHGDIFETLPNINGPFDLLFIDADKPNYDKYLEAVFEKLTIGALVIADNVFWKGRVLDIENNNNAQTRGMIRFAELMQNDKRFESVFLPMKDGFLLSRKIMA